MKKRISNKLNRSLLRFVTHQCIDASGSYSLVSQSRHVYVLFSLQSLAGDTNTHLCLGCVCYLSMRRQLCDYSSEVLGLRIGYMSHGQLFSRVKLHVLYSWFMVSFSSGRKVKNMRHIFISLIN